MPEGERPELLAALVRAEHARRWHAGELPTLAEYKARFSSQGDVIEQAFFSRPSEGGVTYALINELGTGGFGTVFKARDTELQRDVAIKVLKRDLLCFPAVVSGFEQEIRKQAKIEHEGVVRVYGDGRFNEKDNQRFAILQFMAGGSLQDRLRDHPQGIEPTEAARILCEVAAALHRVHRWGAARHQALVHRDLKPGNILFDETGKTHVADFGLAATAGDLHEHEVSGGATILYASPEQVRPLQKRRGSDVDTRSDIWSLGVILYGLLTGKHPFVGSSNEETMEVIERYEPTAPKDLNTAVPIPLDEITRKCLRKDPNERYQTADELAQALRRWLESGDGLPPSPAVPSFLRERRANFSDRPWVFDEVDAWSSAHPNERILLITGDVGTGKSSFVAEFIHRNPNVLAFHCCQYDVPESLAPSRLVRNLAGGLVQHLPGFREALTEPARASLSTATSESEPATAFDLGVVGILGKVSLPNGIRYLVIDGLDESVAMADHAPTITDLLSSQSERLPEWLRVIATTRRNVEVLRHFSSARTLAIDGENQDHTDDVQEDLRRFLRRRLDAPNLQERLTQAKMSAEEAIYTLIKSSECNFLYVTLALQGIERDIDAFDRLDELPRGLDGLFEKFLRNHFPTNELSRNARQVFEVVIATQEPPTAEIIASAATDLEVEYELPELLRKLAVYLPSRQGEGDRCYHFVTSWLAEWVSNKDRAGRFHASRRKGHERLATACWNEYLRNRGSMSGYAARHLPCHLAEAGRWNDLTNLLTDIVFLEAKAGAGSLVGLHYRPAGVFQACEVREGAADRLSAFQKARHRAGMAEGDFPSLTIDDL